MGKMYTFIHKDNVNTKVPTYKLQEYLDNGWELGNWNQEELNAKSGSGVKKHNDQLRVDGQWDSYNQKRNSKVSLGLHKFWSEVADDKYIQDRELKKLETRANWTSEQIQMYHDKMSSSAKLDRANTSKEEYHHRSIKCNETKKKNGTYATSSFENKTYELLIEKYGIDDIVHDDYVDDRYSSKCDFYIKSKDLFIELNIHPSHGQHRFNANNPDDVHLSEQLSKNGDDWSKMILSVWCNRDVQKFEQASKNNLNYIAVYPDDFDNFIQRIVGGNL